MSREEFEQLIAEEFGNAIPAQFRPKIQNVAFLVEDEPSPQVRKDEGLRDDETLLGLYRGIPYPMRGDIYGMGSTMPDTITLYQLPIENAAREDKADVRKVIRETIWHEVAHLFGMDEHTVRHREEQKKRSK